MHRRHGHFSRLSLAGAFAAGCLAQGALAADLRDRDADGDGAFDRQEFAKGIADTGAYHERDSHGDANSEVDETAFGSRYFEAYDADGDEPRAPQEWERLEAEARDRGWFGS